MSTAVEDGVAPPPKTQRKPKKAAPKAAKKAAKPKEGVNASAIVDVANSFKMLGDKTRVSILLNVDGERSVQDLCDFFGQSQPAVSHHLALLRHSGLVVANRTGKTNLYDLTAKGKILVGAINSVANKS